MRRDPLDLLPARGRLVAAALLCLAPMGMVWQIGHGRYTPGMIYDGDCGYDDAGTYVCNPTEYLPGTYRPGSAELVSQAPVRVFLIFAVLALLVAAARGRTRTTVRLARLATVAIGVALLFATSHAIARTTACLVIALLLAAPVVWRERGALASGAVAR